MGAGAQKFIYALFAVSDAHQSPIIYCPVPKFRNRLGSSGMQRYVRGACRATRRTSSISLLLLHKLARDGDIDQIELIRVSVNKFTKPCRLL